MEAWKTVKYSNTQETGPASAIDALVKGLEDLGLAYTVEDFPMWTDELKPEPKKPGSRKSRKTVDDLNLEVRNEDSQG